MNTEHKLKGGLTALDPRLGRLPQFDERSRAFPIRAAIGTKPLRNYTWSCGAWLDQEKESSCVGFSWAHELSARPVVTSVSAPLATKIYKRAQQIDEWPGNSYEGTSVLAGAKAAQEFGYITSYHWAFGLNDLLLALGYAGPVVLGVNWYSSMFSADRDGFLHVAGDLAGGHAILAKAVKLIWLASKSPKVLANVDRTKSFITLHNSWGKDWGVNGEAKVNLVDVDRLLHEQGEACIPMGRKKVKL